MTRQGVANSRSNPHRNRPKLGATVLQRSAECPDTTISCYKISDSLRIRRFCKILSGFVEFAGGRLDAIGIAEMSEPGALVPRGLVKFGLAGKGLWGALDMIRDGPATRSGFVPVKSLLIATIRYFGRYKSSGAIRDGVLIGTPRLLDDQGPHLRGGNGRPVRGLHR